MNKISDLSLQELYTKPKITPSVEIAIIKKEDFREIQPKYCDKVCKLNCKSYSNVELVHEPVNVLIIQDHDAHDDTYKSGARIEKTNREILEQLCRRNLDGLSRRITNLLKCQLEREDLTKGKPPSVSRMNKCAPYLYQEIASSKPKVIISLGTNTTKALGLKKSNYTNRGEVHGNVVLTLHPKVALMIRQNASGKMWGPDYWQIIDRDFKKAGDLARGLLTVPDLDTAILALRGDITITRTINDVVAARITILSLPVGTLISFDTETTGLDPMAPDAKLLCIQFGYRDPEDGRLKAIVIPLWHRDNTWYNPDEAWAHIHDILTRNIPKIGHNVKFDILYIFHTTGVRVKCVVFDTMLVLHNINSGIQGNYGLKRAVWDWLLEMGIGGYEDRLPMLTRAKDLLPEEEEVATD